MPTIFSQGSIKYKVYPGDHNPPHVHVIMGDRAAMIELSTGIVLKNDGFLSADLKGIVATVLARQAEFIEAWETYND